MHILTEVKPLTDFIMECRFSNGALKTVDLKPLLNMEAFLPLRDADNFRKAVNKSYFVEWMGLDIDLSADTLWHLGI